MGRYDKSKQSSVLMVLLLKLTPGQVMSLLGAASVEPGQRAEIGDGLQFSSALFASQLQ